METIAALYSVQPFWVWMALGVILLAVEAAFSTEWLLWPAVSAAILAVLTALGLRMGLAMEVVLFAVLTVAATLLSRRLIQKVNSVEIPDINDRDLRLVGERTRVVEAFVDGRGRVFASGAEWAAEIDGEGPPPGDSVIIDSVAGARVKVRLA
jgi:membrane protein implicated in regulation of membrane protease activity